MFAMVAMILCLLLLDLVRSRPFLTHQMSEMKIRCFNGVNVYLYKERSGDYTYGYGMPVYKTDGTLSTCSVPVEDKSKKGEKYAEV